MNANLVISQQMVDLSSRWATEWLHKSISRTIEVADLEVGEYSDTFSTVYAGEYTLHVKHETKINEEKCFDLQYWGGRDHEVGVGVDYEADIKIVSIDVTDENNTLIAANIQLDKALADKVSVVIAKSAEAKAETNANNYDPY